MAELSHSEARQIHEKATRDRLTKLNTELGSPKTERQIAEHARATAQAYAERSQRQK